MICHPFRKIGQHTAFRLFRKIHAEYTDTAQVTPTAKFRSCFCRVPHTVRTVRKDMRPAARHSLFQYPVPAVRLSFRKRISASAFCQSRITAHINGCEAVRGGIYRICVLKQNMYAVLFCEILCRS